MANVDAFERCLTFIGCQLNPSRQPLREEPRMAVTISRQTGSGAMSIAEELIDYLQTHHPSDCPWTVFDKNLMDKVLEEHHLPARMAKYLPEDRISEINDMMDELLGLHPASWTVVRQTTETILRLAELGNVILIGRGANVVTSKLPNLFHVRLVGSLENRLARVQERNGLTEREARELITRTDPGRARYLKKYFQKHIDDSLLYDLVLNTDRFSDEDAARLIGDALLTRAKCSKELLRETAAAS